ncbi:MAG: hypothetical protein Q4G08_04260 [Capnocytophaga sp.]|nr:hypothetical protein [Capnocytophaga sp.]
MFSTYMFPYRFKRVSGIVFGISFLLMSVWCYDSDLFSPVNPEVPVFAITSEGTGLWASGLFIGEGLSGTHLFSIIRNGILDEILFSILVVSGIIFAFSKEKIEDEMIQKIRSDSLAWALFFNYGLLLFFYLFFYEFTFLYVMMFGMISNLLFYIIRFRWMLHRYYKENDVKN